MEAPDVLSASDQRAPSTSCGRRIRGPGLRQEPSESADEHSPVPGRVRTWHRCRPRLRAATASPGGSQGLAPRLSPPEEIRGLLPDESARMVPGPNCLRLRRPKHRRGDARRLIGSPGRGDARRSTQTHSPERPYAGRSRRPSPAVARGPAVTQTESPRRRGVGVYSKGVTGVNILPQLRLRGQASAPNRPGGIGMTVAAELSEQTSKTRGGH